VTTILGNAGVLTELDQALLAAYCQATVEHRLATEMLERDGRVIADEAHGGRLQAHPANQLQRTAWKAIESFGKLLGLDPASRGRMAESSSVPTVEGVIRRERV
jgi:P27 family predicted phage terminase small subunit